MQPTPHRNSLSFFIYSIFAASLWCFYYAFTQIIIATLRYFILDPSGKLGSIFWRIPFPLNYSQSATFLLVGGGLFFIARALEKSAFAKKHIDATSGPRIWILRLILLAAGFSLTIDFYTLVSSYLAGKGEFSELVMVLVTLGVGACVAFFAVYSLSERFQPHRALLNPCSAGLLSLILGVSSFAIYMAPPSLMKELHKNSTQFFQLQQTQHHIRKFYDKEKKLPDSLNMILSAHFGKDRVIDVITQKPYEYRLVGTTSFELCAVFQRDHNEQRLLGEWYGDRQGFAKFKSGRVCHVFDIENASNPPAP